MNPSPSLSVIIPGFDRVEPLKYTLRSVARAAAELGEPVETILVDDGSTLALEAQLRDFDAGIAVLHVRQPNRGSIVARQTGLRSARGEFVLFLDSDDLIHPQKLVRQLSRQRSASADVSYSDMAVAKLTAGYEINAFHAAATVPVATASAEFFLKVQPAPHNPIYRRDYLLNALARPTVAADRSMDPSGDVWLYYNLAIHPARIVKVGGHYTAPGPHAEDRYSHHWETLGAASLRIMEVFSCACPRDESTRVARTIVGELAFHSWRGLPRGFHAGFAQRMLTIWRNSPRGALSRLGGPWFVVLARIFGPLAAGRLLRLLRAQPYARVRTLSATELAALFAERTNAPSP